MGIPCLWRPHVTCSTSHQRCIYTLCYAIVLGSLKLMLRRRSHGAGWLREGRSSFLRYQDLSTQVERLKAAGCEIIRSEKVTGDHPSRPGRTRVESSSLCDVAMSWW